MKSSFQIFIVILFLIMFGFCLGWLGAEQSVEKKQTEPSLGSVVGDFVVFQDEGQQTNEFCGVHHKYSVYDKKTYEIYTYEIIITPKYITDEEGNTTIEIHKNKME